MGRELRMVPANWEHPKDEQGDYVPLDTEFPYNQEEIEEGLRDGWLTDEPPNYGCDIMPQWPANERTHFQMYENTTEGTPISPVCATIEELARWLADNRASAFADQTATYEQWLATCKRGWAPSAIAESGKGLRSGVAALADKR